jgi:hypothetical protein
MMDDLYFHPPSLGPECSTPRSARVWEGCSRMVYEPCSEALYYRRLAKGAKDAFLAYE